MSNYNRTYWKDSPETEITAEHLNNMEEGIQLAVDTMHRPNLFINGHFTIWSGEEMFIVYGANNEEYTTPICDKWYAKHYDIENECEIMKHEDGLYMRTPSEEPCYIYQKLDEETFNALQGKTLTLSYSYTKDGEETVEESREIVADSDLDSFTAQTRIGLTNDTVLHWAKLEVGTVRTPCIPDSKDAIICKLEKRTQISLAKQSIRSSEAINIGNNQVIPFPPANNFIYGDCFTISNGEFVVGKNVSLVKINVDIDGSFESPTFLYALKNGISVCNHYVDKSGYTGRSFTEIIKVTEGDKIGLSVNQNVTLGTAGLQSHFTIERLV